MSLGTLTLGSLFSGLSVAPLSLHRMLIPRTPRPHKKLMSCFCFSKYFFWGSPGAGWKEFPDTEYFRREFIESERVSVWGVLQRWWADFPKMRESRDWREKQSGGCPVRAAGWPGGDRCFCGLAVNFIASGHGKFLWQGFALGHWSGFYMAHMLLNIEVEAGWLGTGWLKKSGCHSSWQTGWIVTIAAMELGYSGYTAPDPSMGPTLWSRREDDGTDAWMKMLQIWEGREHSTTVKPVLPIGLIERNLACHTVH